MSLEEVLLGEVLLLLLEGTPLYEESVINNVFKKVYLPKGELLSKGSYIHNNNYEIKKIIYLLRQFTCIGSILNLWSRGLLLLSEKFIVLLYNYYNNIRHKL
jgi:hypothetical protein